MVYRNEDTGWSWPFYFKFDTASLQTEADDLRSTPEQPKWAVMTHYGWRNEYFSAFPNAIAIRPVEGPEPDRIYRRRFSSYSAARVTVFRLS